MLSQLGRGLAPAAKRPSADNIKKFIFTNNLPAEVTFTRNSKATCRNAQGKLVEVAANVARIDHYADGTPLGLFIEHGATNKCENTNINPTTTTGLSSAGTGTLTVVNDATELATAGLDDICTNGNVFKAEATSGADFTITINGTTGNTNPHSMILYARGEGTGDAARLSLGGSELAIAPSGNNYAEYKYENVIPASNTEKFIVTVNGNHSIYFILNQLEEADTCSSIIPVDGASVTRPKERARILGVDQTTWFNATQGHMVCRYTLNKLLSTNAYVAVFHSGNSSDTLGYRLTSSTNDTRGYIRASSSNIFTSSNQDYNLAGVLNSGGLRWNASEAEIISGGKSVSGTLTSHPTGITELEIGARNGGIDTMNGHVLSVEIGNQDITTTKLGSYMHKSADQTIVAGGQSLARGYFISQESNSEDGKNKMREVISQSLKDKVIVLSNGSTSGSAASKTSNPTLYWWDLETGTSGPTLDSFYQEINDKGLKPTHALWIQGEDDSHKINIDTTPTQYKSALEFIFNDMRQTLGNVEIFIQKIGRRTSFSNTGGIQTVRDIQQEIIEENEWCFNAAETYDLTLYDGLHLSDSSYIAAAERNALAFLKEPGGFGPSIASASRVNNIITVNIIHDKGNDFTPTSGIEGFTFFDDTSEIAITSAVRTNSTTITLTLASTAVTTDLTLYYGYDAMLGLNTNNAVMDNSGTPLPLRTKKVTLD